MKQWQRQVSVHALSPRCAVLTQRVVGPAGGESGDGEGQRKGNGGGE